MISTQWMGLNRGPHIGGGPQFRRANIREKAVGEINAAISRKDRRRLTKSLPSNGVGCVCWGGPNLKVGNLTNPREKGGGDGPWKWKSVYKYNSESANV